ncbi:type II secretion system protein [Uliginosibacterium sp. H1]|uniref:type II secretion system protein n=1 Tax=Uliginosibacterium sp. H1 TaxID=3114757 RepID=UPI002E190EFF|nr:type II secretion system protein [Uliginosibacterium sp. H1]
MSDPAPGRAESGFTLAEIAVVLVIIALLTAGALSAFRIQNQRAQFAEARAQLEEARQALINYAAVTGALPCPDTNEDGQQDAPCAGGGSIRGDLPWRQLALPQRDTWGSVIRYEVHRDFTATATLSLSEPGSVDIVSRDGTGADVALADPAAVAFAIWSRGADTSDTSEGDTEVVATSPTSDDIVVWLSRFVLIGRLLEAGRDVPQSAP